MIRKSKQQDYEKLTKLWLEASLKAHDFIAADYWKQAADKIKTIYLPTAQTYVFEDKHQLKGFISLLDNNYIAALFVSRGHQKQRIGTKLLQYVRAAEAEYATSCFCTQYQRLALLPKMRI